MAEESGKNDLSGFVERMKARKEAYVRFCEQFESRSKHELVTTVPSKLNPSDTDKIFLYSNIEKPEILEVNLGRKDPVRFGETKFSLHFKRYPASPLIDEKPRDDEFGEETLAEDEPVIDYSQEGILNDLRNKFADLGLPNIPIMKYARRLTGERQDIDRTSARLKADAIVPLYRDLEVKRLITDPNSEGLLKIVTQRQHVYNQLTKLLRESGMDPSQMTEYLMNGLFDKGIIAGMPIFIDKHGNHYVVIDYTYGGHVEENPVGRTDFSGKYEARPGDEVDDILVRARELGYTTHFEDEFISGGTHQRWNWHGIRIDDFDKDDLENNTQKVLDLLKKIGIDPQEIANPNEKHLTDYFIRQVN